jgi:hypothetical protein
MPQCLSSACSDSLQAMIENGANGWDVVLEVDRFVCISRR